MAISSSQPKLPVDVFYQILLRLPAADVHLFRDVSRGWDAMIGSSSFVSDYRRRRSPMPMFFYRRDFDHQAEAELTDLPAADLPALGDVKSVDLAVPLDLPVSTDDDHFSEHDDLEDVVLTTSVSLHAINVNARDTMQLMRFIHVPAPVSSPPLLAARRSVFYIHATSEGILLISYMSRVYACNPCTHHWALLPWMNGSIEGLYGFGPGGNEREFRVLYSNASALPTQYTILSLLDMHPRSLGINGSALAKSYASQGFVARGVPSPLVLEERLLWVSSDAYPKTIVFFDTHGEYFETIDAPKDVTITSLIPINSKVAIASQSGAFVDLWLLSTPNGWTHHRRVGVAHTIWDTLCSPSLDMLIPDGEDTMVHYDTSGHVLKRYHRRGHRVIWTFRSFEESFAVYDCLPMRDDDVDYEGNQPFFKW